MVFDIIWNCFCAPEVADHQYEDDGHPTPRTLQREAAKVRAAEEAQQKLIAETTRAVAEETQRRLREEDL